MRVEKKYKQIFEYLSIIKALDCNISFLEIVHIKHPQIIVTIFEEFILLR